MRVEANDESEPPVEEDANEATVDEEEELVVEEVVAGGAAQTSTMSGRVNVGSAILGASPIPKERFPAWPHLPRNSDDCMS